MGIDGVPRGRKGKERQRFASGGSKLLSA